jgi:hypothetical protein
MQKLDDKPKLRADLTPAERERAERIGWIAFKSAGATRQRYSPEAVDAAIAASTRSGRRIGRGEAKLIHALLKGRSQ